MISSASNRLNMRLLSKQKRLLISHRIFNTNYKYFSTASTDEKWLSDPKNRARWLDVTIVGRDGRAYNDNDNAYTLIDESSSLDFPIIKTENLFGEEIILPDTISIGNTPKVICFSFTQYGNKMTKLWSDPIRERNICPVYELNINEWSFLSFAKSAIMSNFKSNSMSSHHDSILLSFGGVKEFANKLFLPNKYTGYIFLLDGNNKVRWKGAGEPCNGEIDLLKDAIISI